MSSADSKHVAISDLAIQAGKDKSSFLKLVKKLAPSIGVRLLQRRTPKSRGQNATVVTRDDADRLLEFMNSEDWLHTSPGQHRPENENGGFFYIIQIVPDLDPQRVKLGFARDVRTRLSEHRIIAPTATVFRTWACASRWERTAIDSMTRTACQLIGGEVFHCDDLEALARRGDDFFGLLPNQQTKQQRRKRK